VKLSDMPWWTAADAAELDLLIRELVDALDRHRERCAECGAGELTCRKAGAAIEAVVEWRDKRELASRAAMLRAREEARAA